MAEVEVESQSEEPTPVNIYQAANRVLLQEKLQFLKVEEKLMELSDFEINLESLKVLGTREINEASKRGNIVDDVDDDELKNEKIRLREGRDQLHETLIKHKTIHDALQKSVFVTQIQNAVHDSLKNDSVLLPEVRQMMEHYDNNLKICSKLADLFSTMESHEEEVLELRYKYRTLLQTIENKWKQLSGLKPSPVTKLEGHEELAKNVDKRQERLHLLVSLLQNIISGSSEKWGNNDRIIEIMLLCDKAESFLGGYGDISRDIQGLQSAKEKSQKRKIGPMDRFVSSTPKS